MPDVYATISQQPREVVEILAQAMETRAASPQQRAILESYLAHITFPHEARVLEIGCGSGPITAMLAQWSGVAEAVGVDPSPVMLEKARELRGSIPNLSFHEGDGQSLMFEDETFDVVVLHTSLTHIPDPEAAMSEAFRVLRSGGWLAIFDGDYETITVSNHPKDPLEVCIEIFKESFINDLYIVRKLSPLVTSAGFRIIRSDSYSYVETSEPGYLLTIVDRGADTLVAAGSIGEALAAAFKAEAHRRIDNGEFFGHIAYASVIARKLE
jgi:ubiquinone/menaquinone biosynthesis C-methylase UbiE